jgi:hypothetical protein
LELQQQALEDIPGLREEMIKIVETLQQRLSTVEQLALFPSSEHFRSKNKYRIRESTYKQLGDGTIVLVSENVTPVLVSESATPVQHILSDD